MYLRKIIGIGMTIDSVGYVEMSVKVQSMFCGSVLFTMLLRNKILGQSFAEFDVLNVGKAENH